MSKKIDKQVKETVDADGTRHEVIHFTLANGFGQQFTGILREIAWDELDRSNAIVKAIRSLPDMSIDQVEAILDGTKKLATTSDGLSVELVDDDWTPPLEELKEAKKFVEETLKYVGHPCHSKDEPIWLLNHRFESDARDMREDGNKLHEMSKGNTWKALAFAKKVRNFSEKMMDDAARYEEELDKQYEMRAVEERKIAEASQEIKQAKDSLIEELKVGAIQRIATSDMPEDMKRRLIRTTSGIVDAVMGKVVIVVDKQFKNDTGWLSPKGDYYGCEIGQHIELSRLLKEKFFADVEGDSEGTLEKKGWMKCTGAEWWETEQKPTVKQLKVISDWKMKWPDYKYHSRDTYE